MRLASAIYSGVYPFELIPSATDMTTVMDPEDLQDNDILIVWGGADISPSLYGKPVSSRTHGDAKPSNRDVTEWNLMKRAVALGVPIIGVCRGAQMLCALAGGTLFQHVNNHGGTHAVQTKENGYFITNSIHHQMMNPWSVEHEMLASIRIPRSNVHIDVEDSLDVAEEPEYVYFPTVKGHAIQWHPEGMMETTPATRFIIEQVEKRL